MTIAIWVIGLLTLLSGIVGVSNIMFVSVKERTHEIGVRRAIGAKPRSILTMIVTESVAITALFGYIGMIAGVMLTELAKSILDKMNAGEDMTVFSNPTVGLDIAIEVTVVLIIAGAAAGFFPAVKATKISPVEALRDE
jgi:putative ABC transport system permease protein